MFEKIKNIFGAKPEPVKRVRKVAREQEDNSLDEATTTQADIRLGKELFWRRYPHYPEMSTVYRKLFQKFQIDNARLIKVYDAICGTDLCNIVSGSGPNAEYLCDELNASLVELNIKKLGLADKIEKLSSESSSESNQKYFAHIFSFYPSLDDETNVNWAELDENTLPGGYVFIPKLVTNPKQSEKKPSQKLADNITFYFYIDLDHTAHWIYVLESKIETLQKETPPRLQGANKLVIETFKDEVTKWAVLIKKLKSEQIKIVTSVYKHDDVD